jgi:diguanylate cyclase (GGDEF)-like protein
MGAAASPPLPLLDVPTLSLVAVCIAALLGLALIFAWLQQRNVRALAWWGAAYLIGAASIALLSMPPSRFAIAAELPQATIFIACGMIWNGVRLFHGRRLLPIAAFAGAPLWLIVSYWPPWPEGSHIRDALGAVVVAAYTFFIAYELWRERRKSLYSRVAGVVVPCVHAAIFLMPLAMRSFRSYRFADSWLTVLALESIIYGIGTAFIMLVSVKDRHVLQYRTAASTDHLTGLCNRRAFLEAANKMQTRQGVRGAPVTLLIFDLDHFKSVNDRFGHATGDSVLRVFAQVALGSMRASDVVGRLGGEEFAAIVPEAMEDAAQIAERLRIAFEAAGKTVDGHAIGASVSIGLASSCRASPDIDALILRADEALYRAKHGGRNRYCCAENEPGGMPVESAKPAHKPAARRDKSGAPVVAG